MKPILKTLVALERHGKHRSCNASGDMLGLSFGDSRSLSEITPDQMRRFADAACIPASPLWKIVIETAERTAESWKTLEHADALPKDLKDSIGRQILGVTAKLR